MASTLREATIIVGVIGRRTSRSRSGACSRSTLRALLAIALVALVVLAIDGSRSPARGGRTPPDRLAMPRGNLRFEPGDVAVSHGMLIISAYRDPPRPVGPTGGVSSSPGLVQTYGKYFVRFRIDAGVGVSYALLLWPADNSWPPEDRLLARTMAPRATGVRHAALRRRQNSDPAPPPAERDPMAHARRPVAARSLVFTPDGRRWAPVAGSHVAAIPMVMISRPRRGHARARRSAARAPTAHGA